MKASQPEVKPKATKVDKKSKKAKVEDEEGGDQVAKGKEVKTLGPQVQDNELVFGVAHILATWNDTFIHVTDLSGRETLVRVTGISYKNNQVG